MVDAIVSYAVNKLGDFIGEEVVFLKGVKKEVVWLQNELRWMQSFLRDAEQKEDKDERIRIWISEIQDIAYDTEDVIETFLFKVKGSPDNASNKVRMSYSIKNCFCCISRKKNLYDIGKEIKALKNRVLDISRLRERYDIENISTVQNLGMNSSAKVLHDLRITTSYGDEEFDIVGFNDDAQFLEAKLFNGEPRRSVISILGMGGLGKTTLARKLYNNNKTKFDLSAWICVSQEWKTEDLLERLIKSFKELTKGEREMLEKLKDYELEPYLRQILKRHQYLVVIDDVWQKEALESLRRALPDNKNGSRIIITTRKEDVAASSDRITYVHKLRFLRPNEGWELFCKKAFPENCSACPEDMKMLGEEMMTKCGGLPLAIVVLGGLLSNKHIHEWNSVKDDIWRELKNDSIHISSLLALSYKDLLDEMKPCFLYLSIFPEDSIIDAEKLIHLWIAEELIPNWKEGRDAEEVAHYYLKELVRRSLIQVVERNWMMIALFRIHDLLRDLAVNKAMENNFIHVCDETRNSNPSTMATSRRIAFHSGFESYMSLNHLHPRVRTISFLNNERVNQYDASLIGALHLRFGLLRVLDLECVVLIDERKSRLFEGVGELLHLRYLGLARTYTNELPETIGKLQALQTLNVSGSDRPVLLPKEIYKLKQLRHLIGYFKIIEESKNLTPLLFTELINLQTFNSVNIDALQESKRRDILGLNVFATLRNLKYLVVGFYNMYPVKVEPLLKCRKLIRLELNGKIGKIPEDIHNFLTKLQYLKLYHSKFEEDPMPALEKLPNLLVLNVEYNEARTMTWTSSAKGFPRLEILKVSQVLDVKLQIDEEAMPRLRVLCFEEKSIHDPVALDKAKKSVIPERFWSLPGEESMNWKWDDVYY